MSTQKDAIDGLFVCEEDAVGLEGHVLYSLVMV